MNIVLVGFMGTGKTAAAKLLGDKTGMEYVSMDHEIEKREGRSVKEIFAKDGEAYFRKVEKNIAKELSERKNIIIDTGGGVIMDEDNVKVLKGSGRMVCLNATPDVIYERTKMEGHRPILNVPEPKIKIQELLDLRAPYYAKADLQIDGTRKSVVEMVDEIIKLIGLKSA